MSTASTEAATWAASDIQNAISKMAGFGGITFDAPSNQISVYWQGTPPPAAISASGELRGQSVVRFASSKYSQAQLYVERDRLTRESAAGTIPHVYTVGPAPDGSGLVLTVPRGMVDEASAGQTSVTKELGATVDVTVTEGDQPVVGSDRQGDTSPYWGGASIRDVDNQSLCSTGFRVRSGSSYYMVTAWHCSFGNPDTFHTYPGTGSYVGAVAESAHSVDLALLSGANYGDTVYTGAYGTSSWTGVTGVQNAVVGSFVCMEGSFSGNVCNNKVTAVGQNVDYGGSVGIIYDLTLAVNQGGTSAAGEGDSGGPVLASPASNGKVTGMIQGLEPPFSACTGYDGGRACSKQVYFQTYATVDSEFGVAVG